MTQKREDHKINGIGCALCDIIVAERVTFAGNYVAMLCVNCTNDWNAFCAAHPGYVKYQEKQSAVQNILARTMADGEDRLAELNSTRAEELASQVELFEIGRQWMSAE